MYVKSNFTQLTILYYALNFDRYMSSVFWMFDTINEICLLRIVFVSCSDYVFG